VGTFVAEDSVSADPLLDPLRRLEPRGSLLVVTGAGISLASGIPTFRGTDRDAIWKRDVMELGTWGYFEEDPVGSWRWYLSRFDLVFGAKPNAGHTALAALERWHAARGGRFLLVTQNIDTLHEQAGSRAMVKVHGSADRLRCTRFGCVHGAPRGSISRAEVDLARFVERPCAERLPRCPACGAVLRQHVLWFDETYDSHDDYAFDRVLEAAHTPDLVLFVGTSFSVGATDAILRAGRHMRPTVLSLDPGDHAPPPGVTGLRLKAEEALPAVCRALGAA
jgi:NAD-dependent deacetylase